MNNPVAAHNSSAENSPASVRPVAEHNSSAEDSPAFVRPVAAHNSSAEDNPASVRSSSAVDNPAVVRSPVSVVYPVAGTDRMCSTPVVALIGPVAATQPVTMNLCHSIRCICRLAVKKHEHNVKIETKFYINSTYTTLKYCSLWFLQLSTIIN